MAKKLALSHTIPKQTYRVRVRITSGEPSREEATYRIRATNALEAFGRAGIDGLHFFSDDDEAYGHTFSATSAARLAAHSTASMASSPPRRSVAVTNSRSQVGGRTAGRAGSGRP